MSYKVPLPMADVSAKDIRDTIGIGNDNDLSHYVVRAKMGGESPNNSQLNLAFRVIENGYASTDGVLLGIESDGENSYPYFNIWSKRSPGEWLYTLDPSDSTYKILFRLARNSYGDITVGNNTFNSSSYCYDLGRFRGYNHLAPGPRLYVPSVQDIDENQSNNVLVVLKLNIGEIDWATAINSDSSILQSEATYAKVQVVGNSSISSSYLSLQGLMLGEQSITMTLPPEADYTFEVVLYIFYIDRYYQRGKLPLTTTSNPSTIHWSQTLRCMSIKRSPVITQLVINDVTYNQTIAISFNNAINRWMATFQLQYTSSSYYDDSKLYYSRYDCTSSDSIYGSCESLVVEDIMVGSNNLHTSEFTIIFSTNDLIAPSIARQEYKVVLYFS